MFDSSIDRVLSGRLGLVYDHGGVRRTVRRGTRNGLWFLDPTSIDDAAVHEAEDACEDDSLGRIRALEALRTCGWFTPLEFATLDALTIEKLTIGEIADRDGCSRQAVMARLVGNSRGQGGILRKALKFHEVGQPDSPATS